MKYYDKLLTRKPYNVIVKAGKPADEENERILRIYSKSSIVEYTPREMKREDMVTAKPVELPKCAVCGKSEPEPFECEHCGKYYCDEHLAPEKHKCSYEKEEREKREQEELELKMALMARFEEMIAHRPDIYMIIDRASAKELKALMKCLDELNETLADISLKDVEK